MTDVDALGSELRRSFGRERSGAAADLTIAIWERLRSGGRPIAQSEALRLAADAGLSPDEAEAVLGQSAERDTGGEIAGFSGLSLNEHPHRIDFGDRALSAWCAYDPFFLVPALDGHAHVSTKDPLSGADIELTFRGGVVAKASPASPVVSIVIPERADGEPGCGESVDAMLLAFCSQVHLFENIEHLERYFAERESHAVALSLDEAAALAAPREVAEEGRRDCAC